MLVPVKTSEAQLVIKGSRFLAQSFIISSQNEVRTIIKSQKTKYADATHVCHAFIAGKDAEVMGMSDDGEPGGTAGRPMLDVLKGRGVTNVLVTVTRWFGGTLLGTGGLVHAYGESVKAVLETTVFEEFVEKTDFEIKADYQTYQAVKKILSDYTLYDVEEDFGELVTVKGNIAIEKKEEFTSKIFDLTNGKTVIR
jgi:uncharacterized YigZ family protein